MFLLVLVPSLSLTLSGSRISPASDRWGGKNDKAVRECQLLCARVVDSLGILTLKERVKRKHKERELLFDLILDMSACWGAGGGG